uniref:Uncharacterized protein n=1 Tax=Rhizophora mucronata TaxID=61149 RepID=A0A2P2PSV3_RHIMU
MTSSMTTSIYYSVSPEKSPAQIHTLLTIFDPLCNTECTG